MKIRQPVTGDDVTIEPFVRHIIDIEPGTVFLPVKINGTNLYCTVSEFINNVNSGEFYVYMKIRSIDDETPYGVNLDTGDYFSFGVSDEVIPLNMIFYCESV